MYREYRRTRHIRWGVNVVVCILCCMISGSIGIKYGKKMVGKPSEIVTEIPVEKKMFEVIPILQNPELPTGCEATAVTMLLCAYGYEADKTEIADYMQRGTITEHNERGYAPHPDDAFIGDPYSKSGYGAFPKVLEKAAQEKIDEMGGKHRARALYGLTEQELLQKIDEGIPVCVWTSMQDKEIEYRRGWYLIKDGQYTEEYFEWPSNEHVVVLTDYDEGRVKVCDPMVGECQYPRESFFRHYRQVGMYSLEIME